MTITRTRKQTRLTGREYALPAGDTMGGTGNATLTWSVPVVELNVVNTSDAELTFVVTDTGGTNGKTIPVPANASRPYVAPSITQIDITSPGVGKWYVDAFR